ncbi:gamma-glutamyltransferase [Altererythrobacter sp. CAU 1778]
MIARIASSASLALLLAACQVTPASLEPSPPFNGAGAVSAADPRAQAAGEEMLRLGGNATDAAIATMLALTVVEPQSSGIGGGGFLVRGEADGSVTSFDGRETAPATATPEWFLAPDGSVPPFEASVKSGLSVGVPGNVAMAAKAHAAHGKLDWATLFGPAIKLSREGFRINPRLRQSLISTAERAAWTEKGRSLYFNADGTARAVGSLVTNEELAQTFEAIAAAGPEALYSGMRADRIATTVAAQTPHAGKMTAADIAGYQAKQRAAVCGSYRGYRVCGMGPPTSGGIAVLQMLGQLERFDLSSLGVDNPATWHLFVESQRLAYADRELYLGDSDFVSVPVAGLIEPTYIAQRSALISAGGSIADPKPGVPAGAVQALADGDEPEEHGTSHIAAVDGTGTMVSYTSTIESAFGSGLMANGFYLNNELTDFSRTPAVDGRMVANRVEGGKRPRSSMSPMVVWDPQGRPMMAIGAAGGATIPVQTARSIIGIIDFGLSGEEALGLPFIMGFGDTVMVEQGSWLERAIPALNALGHAKVAPREAGVKAGVVLRGADGWTSARDPRLAGKLDMP